MVNDMWKLFELAVLTRDPMQFSLYSLYHATQQEQQTNNDIQELTK